VDICDTLNADGILTPGGGLRWWPSHVHRLLRTRDGRELLDRARSQSQRHERAGLVAVEGVQGGDGNTQYNTFG
jgi:hypothetical protein